MKRSGPLARKTPLARGSKPMARSRMRRSRPKGQPAERSDRPYLAWLRKQPCSMTGKPGPCDAHHPRHGAGLGLKAPDQKAISLRPEVHTALHMLAGPFKGWDRERLQQWEDEQGRRLRAEYEASTAADGRGRMGGHG